MKHVLLIALLFTIPSVAQTQELYIWMALSRSRIIVNATWVGMAGDSIEILRGGKSFFVPIEEIEQIRIMREGSIMEGAAVGAGIGLAVGTVAGLLARPSNDRHGTLETSALTICLIGGIVGSVTGSLQGMEETVTLTGKTTVTKIEIISRLVLSR